MKKFDLLFLRFSNRFCDTTIFLQQIQNDTTMTFRMKDVYIGQMIQKELIHQGRTVNWFAKEIFCEKSNIYKLFRRKSIDLAQLMKISEVLNHNFLKDCYEES